MKEQFYPRLGEAVHSARLANGLTVRVAVKPDFAKKYAFFAVRYGGMDTRFFLDGKWRDTPAGIAHYLEHKMFDTREGNALQELAKNGAEPNAFTANAMTGYYFDSVDHFEDNLRILLSFVSIPYFTDESVAKEQGIIAQEIRMVEDNPSWQVYHQMLQAMYHRHAARTSIAGTVESISHITADTLYDCHKAFYTPSNMVLTVVGDVDPIHVCDLAAEVLPRISGSAIERDYGDEPETVAQSETAAEMEVAMPQFLAGFKCRDAGAGEARFRSEIVGDLACEVLLGESSPLYQRLYEAGKINPSFGGEYDTLPGAAFLSAGGDGKEPRFVLDAILEEGARIARDGVDEALFARLKKALFGTELRALNSLENTAISLSEGCFFGYDPMRFPEVFDAVDSADVAAFIRENITPERAVLSCITPKERKAGQGR